MVNPINALETHQSHVYVDYCYDEGCHNVDTDFNIKKGHDFSANAALYVDGSYRSFRWLHLYIYDSNGKEVYCDQELTGFNGKTLFIPEIGRWDYGTYKITIIYWGSDDGEWLKGDKTVNMHII